MQSNGLQRHCAYAQARRNMSTSSSACTRAQEYRFTGTDSRAQILTAINENSFYAVKEKERKVRSWHCFLTYIYVHFSGPADGRVTRALQSLRRKDIMPVTSFHLASNNNHIRIEKRRQEELFEGSLDVWTYHLHTLVNVYVHFRNTDQHPCMVIYRRKASCEHMHFGEHTYVNAETYVLIRRPIKRGPYVALVKWQQLSLAWTISSMQNPSK